MHITLRVCLYQLGSVQYGSGCRWNRCHTKSEIGARRESHQNHPLRQLTGLTARKSFSARSYAKTGLTAND